VRGGVPPFTLAIPITVARHPERVSPFSAPQPYRAIPITH